MEDKRSVGVTILGGIFLGAVILPILFIVLKLVDKYQFMEIFLFSIIYLGCALVVFNKWFKLASWQKGSLVAIGIQYLLLFIWESMLTLFLNRSLTGVISWLVTDLHFVLSPLEALYTRFIISPRAVIAEGGAAYLRVSYWETGLLFGLFRIIYASVIGIIVSKLIKNRTAHP